jgi:hypothetical protein
MILIRHRKRKKVCINKKKEYQRLRCLPVPCLIEPAQNFQSRPAKKMAKEITMSALT